MARHETMMSRYLTDTARIKTYHPLLPVALSNRDTFTFDYHMLQDGNQTPPQWVTFTLWRTATVTLLLAEMNSLSATSSVGRNMWFSKSVRVSLRRDTVSNLGTQIYKMKRMLVLKAIQGCARCVLIGVSPSICFQRLRWRGCHTCPPESGRRCSRVDLHRISPSHLCLNPNSSIVTTVRSQGRIVRNSCRRLVLR